MNKIDDYKKNSLWDAFEEETKRMGVFLSREAIGQFSLYLEELNLWNNKINLFKRKNDREIIIKDFLDSLTVCKHLPLKISLVDIGSGGGFPGIPIKIARNDLRVVLSEVRTKKIFFLKNMVRILGLKNLEVMSPEYDKNEKFDFAVFRAFGSFSKMIDTGFPYIKEKGTIICMKGRKGQEELSRELPFIKEKGWIPHFVEQVELPIIGDKRVLIGLRSNVSRETSVKQ